MPYTLPADVDERPVVIDGAGTLGRRIAAVYAGGASGILRAAWPAARDEESEDPPLECAAE